MPCLDEKENIGLCVRQAHRFLQAEDILGEVIVADNGSRDGSPAIAEQAGARVIRVREPGYGAAVREGVKAARGEFIIMGDADSTYAFNDLNPFVERLQKGYDLVVGNRFRGKIERGAMPKLHRYFGVPLLSLMGKCLLRNFSCGDFHCGLRAFKKDIFPDLGLQTTGMEFATEMIMQAITCGYSVTEVPTTLKKAAHNRQPHLRTWRDGWRHVRLMLAYTPRWLLFIAGILMLIASGIAAAHVITHGMGCETSHRRVIRVMPATLGVFTGFPINRVAKTTASAPILTTKRGLSFIRPITLNWFEKTYTLIALGLKAL